MNLFFSKYFNFSKKHHLQLYLFVLLFLSFLFFPDGNIWITGQHLKQGRPYLMRFTSLHYAQRPHFPTELGNWRWLIWQSLTFKDKFLIIYAIFSFIEVGGVAILEMLWFLFYFYFFIIIIKCILDISFVFNWGEIWFLTIYFLENISNSPSYPIYEFIYFLSVSCNHVPSFLNQWNILVKRIYIWLCQDGVLNGLYSRVRCRRSLHLHRMWRRV